MKKQEDRANGARGRKDGGPPERPENGSPWSPGSPARALALSSAVVTICFLLHVLILCLVEPLKILYLSKLNAYATSIIPLGIGLVFFLDAIRSFIRIESRSAVHFVLFLLAVLFGSFGIHGLLGFLLYLMRHPPAF
jgi:hypothetical protein